MNASGYIIGTIRQLCRENLRNCSRRHDMYAGNEKGSGESKEGWPGWVVDKVLDIVVLDIVVAKSSQHQQRKQENPESQQMRGCWDTGVQYPCTCLE